MSGLENKSYFTRKSGFNNLKRYYKWEKVRFFYGIISIFIILTAFAATLALILLNSKYNFNIDYKVFWFYGIIGVDLIAFIFILVKYMGSLKDISYTNEYLKDAYKLKKRQLIVSISSSFAGGLLKGGKSNFSKTAGTVVETVGEIYAAEQEKNADIAIVNGVEHEVKKLEDDETISELSCFYIDLKQKVFEVEVFVTIFVSIVEILLNYFDISKMIPMWAYLIFVILPIAILAFGVLIANIIVELRLFAFMDKALEIFNYYVTDDEYVVTDKDDLNPFTY